MNMNDIEIRSFFNQNKPQISDGESFLAGLNDRMNQVVEIKKMQEAVIRRYRIITLSVLVAGMVIGGAVAAFLFLHPAASLNLRTVFSSTIISVWSEWKMVICGIVAVVSMILGLIPWRRRLIV